MSTRLLWYVYLEPFDILINHTYHIDTQVWTMNYYRTQYTIVYYYLLFVYKSE